MKTGLGLSAIFVCFSAGCGFHECMRKQSRSHICECESENVSMTVLFPDKGNVLVGANFNEAMKIGDQREEQLRRLSRNIKKIKKRTTYRSNNYGYHYARLHELIQCIRTPRDTCNMY